MFDSCEFYLEFTLGRTSISLEYLEYQIYSIPGNHTIRFEYLIYFKYLMRLEDVSYDQEICMLMLHFMDYLIEFSSSDIGIVIRKRTFLDVFEDHDSSKRRYQVF